MFITILGIRNPHLLIAVDCFIRTDKRSLIKNEIILCLIQMIKKLKGFDNFVLRMLKSENELLYFGNVSSLTQLRYLPIDLFIENDPIRRRNQTVSTVFKSDEEDVWLSL